LSLLSKYIVDSDVKVVEAATTALFKILSTKDGRKVAGLLSKCANLV
jgi:hypothetical protein